MSSTALGGTVDANWSSIVVVFGVGEKEAAL
jgi:hypothetical protein